MFYNYNLPPFNTFKKMKKYTYTYQNMNESYKIF